MCLMWLPYGVINYNNNNNNNKYNDFIVFANSTDNETGGNGIGIQTGIEMGTENYVDILSRQRLHFITSYQMLATLIAWNRGLYRVAEKLGHWPLQSQ